MSPSAPAEWIDLAPGSAERLHRSDLGPCRRCGGAAFEVRRQVGYSEDGEPSERLRVVCPACVPRGRELVRGGRRVRDAEATLRTIDMRTGETIMLEGGILR